MIVFLPFSGNSFEVTSSNSITFTAVVGSSSPAVNLISGSSSGYLTPTGGVLLFRGYAYPQAVITLAKNGQKIVETIADNNAFFEISLTKLYLGNTVFILNAQEISLGDFSISYKFNINIEKNSNLIIDNITFPATLNIINNENKDSELLFFGRSVPNSKILILIEPNNIQLTSQANELGNWSIIYNTKYLFPGTYNVKVKTSLNNLLSEFSAIEKFTLKDKIKIPIVEEKVEEIVENLPIIELPLYPMYPIISDEQIPKKETSETKESYMPIERFSFSIYYLLIFLIPLFYILLRKKDY